MESEQKKKQETLARQEQKDGQLQKSTLSAGAERNGPKQEYDLNGAMLNSGTLAEANKKLASGTEFSAKDRQYLENQTRVARGNENGVPQQHDLNGAMSNEHTRAEANQRLAIGTQFSAEERQKLENQTRVARGPDNSNGQGVNTELSKNTMKEISSRGDLCNEARDMRKAMESKAIRVPETARKEKLKEQ